MAKRSAQPASPTDEPSPERAFAEEFGLVGERMGMPRTMARLLGWMLICSPPQQSSADLVRALGVSRASISIATRLLEASSLIKRVGRPGTRGHVYELDLQIFTGQLNAANPFGAMRRVMVRGIELLGDETSPQADRLREARDFYAFVESAVPEVIGRYRAERATRRESGR